MASVGVLQGSTRLVEAGIEHSHKGGRICNLPQYLIEIFDDRSGSVQLPGHKGAGLLQARASKEMRRLRGRDISNNNVHHVVGDLKEVVVISTQ